MDDLYAKFLPQFVTLARARVTAALAAVTQPQPGGSTTMVRDLHTLAGEAGLLGLGDLVPLARDCERRAKALSAGTSADAEELVAALRQLERVIESIAATIPA